MYKLKTNLNSVSNTGIVFKSHGFWFCKTFLNKLYIFNTHLRIDVYQETIQECYTKFDK